MGSGHGLYSDAAITGDLWFGPHHAMCALAGANPQIGVVELQVVLRYDDHLLAPEDHSIDLEEQHVDDYAGGSIGDEVAALLALALGRRIRSGGAMRLGFDTDLVGMPIYMHHARPSLQPPLQMPMIPSVGSAASLTEARALFDAYAALDGRTAVALVRAAGSYADALWWADADPRASWIKLFGALEAAADCWSTEAAFDLPELLRRRHPALHKDLQNQAPDVIPIVAKRLSRVLGAERKMLDFTLEFGREPPDVRPSGGRINFDDIEPDLRVLYDHRSKDLHAGIPFPWPLLVPPMLDHAQIPYERTPALGAASSGGSWPAHRMPMHLHTFAHIVGGALRNWWLRAAR